MSVVTPSETLPGCRCPQAMHGSRVWYHPEWKASLGELVLSNIDNWRVPRDVPAVSHSRYAVACYRLQLSCGRVVYYKRYDYRGRWKSIISFWMRPSKAGIEKWGYLRYRDCGVDVPTVVAYGESRFLGLLQVAFIITEEVADTVPLDRFVADTLPGLDRDRRSEKMSGFATRLITAIRASHGARLFHYDLKWRNILVQSRNGAYYPVIIDCPRAFTSRLRWRYGVTTDFSALARLAVSYLTLTQRYRFLAACLGDTAGPDERKYWFRRIQKRLEKRPPRIIALQESPLHGVRFDKVV